jgi:hypothetical protein
MIDTSKLLSIKSTEHSTVYYDPETGIFYREVRGKIKKTSETTTTYISVEVDGVVYRAGRLAWFMYYGKWPEKVIDHINGNPADNRICNLRDVSQQENTLNCRKYSAPKTFNDRELELLNQVLNPMEQALLQKGN